MLGTTTHPVVETGPASLGEGAAGLDDTFDRELMSHLLRHAARAAEAAGQPVEKQLGVTHSQLAAIVAYAGLDDTALIASDGTPSPDDEELMLQELLLRHRSQPGDIGEWLACIIARRAMEPNHLWEDLGLPERPDLTKLLLRHFQTLAANNTRNMRWKRFLYRAICESEGFTMCPSPTCDACSEFHICYSGDDGPSGLARNGREAKAIAAE
jgi:nitrogen fixation protein NifQ